MIIDRKINYGILLKIKMINKNLKNNEDLSVNKPNNWYLIDAKDKILGRLSSFLAIRLMGKHQVSYSDNVCPRDKIVVINANKVILTGKKMNKKNYWHTGYPGGIKSKTYKEILSNPYFSSAVSNKHNIVANILRPRPSTSKTAPQPKKSRNPASVARELREKEEENAKKQRILKKPGVVAQTVRLLPGRTPRPLVFINKNGDIKINRRKCMSHTKEELIKIAKKRGITLSQSLTKRDMCKELLK